MNTQQPNLEGLFLSHTELRRLASLLSVDGAEFEGRTSALPDGGRSGKDLEQRRCKARLHQSIDGSRWVQILSDNAVHSPNYVPRAAIDDGVVFSCGRCASMVQIQDGVICDEHSGSKHECVCDTEKAAPPKNDHAGELPANFLGQGMLSDEELAQFKLYGVPDEGAPVTAPTEDAGELGPCRMCGKLDPSWDMNLAAGWATVKCRFCGKLFGNEVRHEPDPRGSCIRKWNAWDPVEDSLAKYRDDWEEWDSNGSCSCHIAPPCSHCTETPTCPIHEGPSLDCSCHLAETEEAK